MSIENIDLFGIEEREIVRTLGFYQPFCSLMLHGKIETRWVREGKKPPFPLGKYVLYSTLNPCEEYMLFDWCGIEIMTYITSTLLHEPSQYLNGVAIAEAQLVQVRKLTEEDLSFVKFKGREIRIINGKEVAYVQWALIFKNVTPIEPFEIKGKQGVGILKSKLVQ